jgi:hypothetical protein
MGLCCTVEYTNANQQIMAEAFNIWVQYTQSEENDHNNTFQGRITNFAVFYFSWTPTNHILQFQEGLPAGKPLSSFSKRFNKTQPWVLHLQAYKYAEAISTMYRNLRAWPDCVDGFIPVVKQTNKMPIVPVAATGGPAHLVWENDTLGSFYNVWLVNTYVDLDTYWTDYELL